MCDKQKRGYTKKVMHSCLGYYENLNALGPSTLGHLNPHSALDTNAKHINKLVSLLSLASENDSGSFVKGYEFRGTLWLNQVLI